METLGVRFCGTSILGALFVLLSIGIGGCERSDSRAREARVSQLNVYNWSNYIGRRTISDFHSEFGVDVLYETYTSNEELLSELKTRSRRYDVIFPSDHIVPEMIEGKWLSPLDKSKLSNIHNIDRRFLGLPYDPDNTYCIPYNWGTTGLAVNSDRVKKEVRSWSVLWDEEFAGRVSILNEPRSGFLPAIKRLGFSANTTDREELEKAKKLLLELKPLLKAFSSDRYLEFLRNGTVWIAVGYSGDVIRLANEKPGIVYVIPEEGTDLWVDNVCIPADAGNKELAHTFINYLLRPEVAARITNDTGFASANAEAKRFIKREVLQNPAVYPPEELLNRIEYAKPLGAEGDIYYELWDEVLKTPAAPKR